MLVIGAGMVDSQAALMAARRGVRVAQDKAPIDVSGSGGRADHYGGCNSNPDCAISPEQYMELMKDSPFSVVTKYISMKGAWITSWNFSGWAFGFGTRG